MTEIKTTFVKEYVTFQFKEEPKEPVLFLRHSFLPITFPLPLSSTCIAINGQISNACYEQTL